MQGDSSGRGVGSNWVILGISQLQSQLLLLNVQMFQCFDVQTFKMFTCIAIAQVGVCEATGDSELGAAPLCLCLQPPIKEHRYLGGFYFLYHFHILFYFSEIFFVSFFTSISKVMAYKMYH